MIFTNISQKKYSEKTPDDAKINGVCLKLTEMYIIMQNINDNKEQAVNTAIMTVIKLYDPSIKKGK